ncbi:MAG: FAD-binding oxidoreductase [Myxococcota bacterium]
MQHKSDVVVIGGGVVGSATAYFLAKSGVASVVVVEKDPSYEFASTSLSAASIRQQFTTDENVAMSRFAVGFFQNLADELELEPEQADVGFVEGGYLFLSDANREQVLREAYERQRKAGVDVALLEPDALAERFPWLNLEDIHCGALGLSGEGWFDAYTVLMAFKKRARSLGVQYVQDEAERIVLKEGKVHSVVLREGGPIQTHQVVNAAGPRAAELAATIGVHLPVRARKRQIFVFRTSAKIPETIPLVVDPSGVYFRPEGNAFLCGWSPPEEADPDASDFKTDASLFETQFWPVLAHRVPSFDELKVVRSWAGHYAVNTVDHNAIVGSHEDIPGYYSANGFSGHGLMQSPAIARALSELIVHGGYQTLDLSRLSFDRLRDSSRHIVERHIL